MRIRRDKAYFTALSNMFSYTSVYYPGCGADRKLEGIVGDAKITYLDEKQQNVPPSSNFILGNITDKLFPDGSFDLVFFQDLHPGTDGNSLTSYVLKPLKKDGVLLYSARGCGHHNSSKDLEALKAPWNALVEIENSRLHVTHPDFHTFIKVR